MKEAEATTRRAVFVGTGAAGLGIALAGCGAYDQSGGQSGDQPEQPPGGDYGRPPKNDAAGDEIAKKSDIPVGGGVVDKERKIVVTQPKEGEFKAFTAVCTHRGCTVGTVQDGTIKCPCHGSQYSAADGSVTGGPAERPLEAKEIGTEGDSITFSG